MSSIISVPLSTTPCTDLPSRGLYCTGESIIDKDSIIIYDLDRPSAKFQAVFAWVTGVSLSLKLGKVVLELVQMAGFAGYEPDVFPTDEVNLEMFSRGRA